VAERIDTSLNAVVLGRRLWSGVPRRERRRIQDAVKHDELLRDPDEAEKLVEVAGRRRLKWRRPGRLYLIALLVLIVCRSGSSSWTSAVGAGSRWSSRCT
jgi:hypothetical protein